MSNDHQIYTLLLDLQKQIGALSSEVKSISVEVTEIKSRLELGDKQIVGSKSSIMRLSEQIRALPCNNKEDKVCNSTTTIETVSESLSMLKDSKIMQRMILAGIGIAGYLATWIVELIVKNLK